MSHGEQPRRSSCLRDFNGSVEMVNRSLVKQLVAFARRITNMQDHVADRVVVELHGVLLARIGGQLQLPFAYRA